MKGCQKINLEFLELCIEPKNTIFIAVIILDMTVDCNQFSKMENFFMKNILTLDIKDVII